MLSFSRPLERSKNPIKDKVERFICKYKEAIAIVSGDGFQHLIIEQEPAYKVPSQTISTHIVQMYGTTRENMETDVCM